MNPKRASLFPSCVVAAVAAFASLHLLASSAIAGTVPAQGYGLKGVVFEDSNEDGVKDDAEFGAGGVIVDLLDADAKHVTRELTQPDGTYRFANLQPGIYFLRFEFSPGFAVRSQGISVGPKGGNAKGVVNGKGVVGEEGGEGGDTVFTPVPVISPDSRYNFTRLNLINPASFMGNEVSPFTP